MLTIFRVLRTRKERKRFFIEKKIIIVQKLLIQVNKYFKRLRENNCMYLNLESSVNRINIKTRVVIIIRRRRRRRSLEDIYHFVTPAKAKQGTKLPAFLKCSKRGNWAYAGQTTAFFRFFFSFLFFFFFILLINSPQARRAPDFLFRSCN